MGNQLKGLANHSAEYFGDTRDFWWHDDQLARLTQVWRLHDVKTVLDVGCGVGHWSRVLARGLPADASLIGVDRDPLWIEKATERAVTAGLAQRFHYRVSQAESLPFEDERFDLVTCQTLLMHVADPARVVAEMVRVTRPGGLVVLAEPTNVADPLVESTALDDPPEVVATLVLFQLICHRGKRLLGEGDHAIGESLPRLLTEAGLEGVELRQNERCWTLNPPYRTPFEQTQISEELDAAERDFYVWDEATTRRYHAAGGGDEQTFAHAWRLGLDQRRRTAAALRAGRYVRAGGGLFYVGWGRRPSS